jgi:hypothetical protein
MSRSKHPSILDKFLEQERSPAFTAISVFTSVLVWLVLMADLCARTDGWGVLAQFYGLILVFLLGLLIKSVVGAIAASRGEYCGGRIAAIGVALWFLTVLIFFLLRGNRLWL